MNDCAICGATLKNYDDEICDGCVKELQAYHEETKREALAYAEWAESDCEGCGLPNPICDCELVVSGD